VAFQVANPTVALLSSPVEVHWAVLWLISLALRGRGSLMPLPAPSGAQGSSGGGPAPCFEAAACSASGESLGLRERYLWPPLTACRSASALAFHRPGAVRLVGLQTQQGNERRL